MNNNDKKKERQGDKVKTDEVEQLKKELALERQKKGGLTRANEELKDKLKRIEQDNKKK